MLPRTPRLILLAVFSSLLTGCAATRAPAPAKITTPSRVDILNALRNDMNAAYGYRDGVPRINLGPCGRFARDFRRSYNARFPDKVNIAFVMAADGSQCHHVLVKFPDGTYYDGGNGLITAAALLRLYPGARLDEMKPFDPALLDARSYGLARSYPECPNYSDALTNRLIETHLAMLPAAAAQ